MAFMNRYEGALKFQALLDALTDCDHRRSYYLSLATCYCTPEAVREFIDAIRDRLNIVEIYLYLSRREAIRIGHAELTAIERDYSDVLSIYAVKGGRLFHTKGYCLAAYSGDDLVHGRLAIGSANLTRPGLTGEHGNVESLAIHSDIATIGEFLEFFEVEDNWIELKDLTDFSSYDDTDFQYALLTSGWFSHKWSATLATYFSVRYHLNEAGRQRAQGGIANPRFQMDTASISNREPYFQFDLQRWQSEDKDLGRKYGVECFLGHWIPKPVVGDDEENNERFREFKTKLFKKLDKRMDRICKDIRQDYESLTQQGIIVKQDADPTQAFQERIEALGNDDDQLYRIWSGRHFFELPYDLGDVEAIRETFDDILRTARRRKRRNKTMNAVLEAEEYWTLEPLQTLLPAGR